MFASMRNLSAWAVRLDAKLIGVIGAVIVFGAWLMENVIVERVKRLRDDLAKAEQDQDASERSFRTESRLIELYQVAASARDYSHRNLPPQDPAYLQQLYEDIEMLERTGVAREFAQSMVGYSSRSRRLLETIKPPRAVEDRVATANKGIVDFASEIDERRERYQEEQKQLVGDVINPNTITEQQAKLLSSAIRKFRSDIEISLMPRFAPLANEVFRSYDEMFQHARQKLHGYEKNARVLRWMQIIIFIIGSIVVIFGSYLDATHPSHP
jgi:hypothetical protein